MKLKDLVVNSAVQFPDALAIKGPDTCLTYAQLDALANSFAYSLAGMGVRRGDRVGIWHEKSACSVAAMQGVLRLGAIYVPLDPLSPASRVLTIVENCQMRVLISTQKRIELLSARDALPTVVLLPVEQVNETQGEAEMLPIDVCEDDDIAYILYTSGSTGIPKGVCISNRNALAFVEWAAHMAEIQPGDHLANHAPFHFDLSVLDLYVAFLGAASVFLIADGASYLPTVLTRFVAEEAITIWYSVPSVLILMMEQGGLFDVSLQVLRLVLFAGEPFPLRYLRQFCEHWSDKRFVNLYGPTETNVCTFYEVERQSLEQTKLLPIGIACSGDHVWAQKDDGSVAAVGEEGELFVAGPTVMVGYWGQPVYGQRPYATGDFVRLQADGNYVYLGRRDHLVKVRGHRVELGEIEAALGRHPAIREVAVLITGTEMNARLIAYVVPVSADGPPLTLLEVKRHCAMLLPRYMIIDTVRTLSALPRTRNGKIDRLALSQYETSTLTEGAKHATR